jgi:hypothetical protein
MFNLDKKLNKKYMVDIDEESYARSTYFKKDESGKIIGGKSYSELNDTQKSIVDSSVENLSTREKLRVAKKLFDADAKLIQNSVGKVNEFMSLRKDVRDVLEKIDFDFIKEFKNPDTDLSRYSPAFSKKGISEFLNISGTLQDPKKLEQSEEFYA